MESSEPLSVESFSYRWLVNLKPARESFDGSSVRTSLDVSDEASFIEMDPRMPPSRRFSQNRGNSASQDFKFDFPGVPSSPALVHADELFSDGYMLPLFLEHSKMKAYEPSNSTPTQPGSLKLIMSSSTSCSPPSSKTRCRKLSKRMFHKYMDFLRPLYRIFRAGRSSFRAEFGDKKGPGIRNWVYPEEASSPRISEACSANDLRRSFDSESSIYEAVLHCKKSFGKFD
ncbi:hypothetical protein ACJRO7_006212 [Eucalyptus globulus]|uniref:Membrane-associated kinase regulator 6 n=1 Tax=Eucalyptus globulus TaxID=34317 RepID=A0ABD3IMV3_EUCGL